MGVLRDLTGQVFGRLTVIGQAKSRTSSSGRSSYTFWICQCECGNIKEVQKSALANGSTKSCGCLLKETRKVWGSGPGGLSEYSKLPPGEAPLRALYGRNKRSAKERGIAHSLSKEEFASLIEQDCHYCGEPPSRILDLGQFESNSIVWNGIDRIDSSKGYIISNCVTACTPCNRLKKSKTYEEFLNLVQAIYENRIAV